jgi:hypothetical protein
MFQLSEQGIGDTADAWITVLVTKALDSRNKTGPWAGFEFVEHRGYMYFFSHSDDVPVYLYERFPFLSTFADRKVRFRASYNPLGSLGKSLAPSVSLLESHALSYPPLGVL